MLDYIKNQMNIPTDLPQELKWENINEGILPRLEAAKGKKRNLGFFYSTFLLILLIKTCIPIEGFRQLNIRFGNQPTILDLNISKKAFIKNEIKTSNPQIILPDSNKKDSNNTVKSSNVKREVFSANYIYKSIHDDWLGADINEIDFSDQNIDKEAAKDKIFIEKAPTFSVASELNSKIIIEEIFPTAFDLKSDSIQREFVILPQLIKRIEDSRFLGSIFLGTSIWDYNSGISLAAIEKDKYEKSRLSSNFGVRIGYDLFPKISLISGLEFTRLKSKFQKEFMNSSSGARKVNKIEFSLSNGFIFSKVIKANGRTIKNGELFPFNTESQLFNSGIRFGINSEVGISYHIGNYVLSVDYGTNKYFSRLSNEVDINLNPLTHNMRLHLGYKF